METPVTIRLHDFKRKAICPVLARQGWDYYSLTEEERLFNRIFMEWYGWYSRRGSKLNLTVADSMIGRICLKEKADMDIAPRLHSAIRSYNRSSLSWTTIKDPVVNILAQIKIKNTIIDYHVPVYNVNEQKHTFLLQDQGIKNSTDLYRSYEARMIAVWSFYFLDAQPSVYNIRYLDDGEVDVMHIRCTQKYIKESKIIFSNLEHLLYNRKYLPPNEVCSGCSRRNECPATIAQLK
jgi:hypothetical protein